MIISKELEKAMNAQIGSEFGASLQYVSIASYFMADDMLRFGHIFFLQADEERMHAMKFVNFILEAGGHVVMPALPAPRSDFKSPEDAIGAALAWEEEVTRQINGLMDIAVKDKDYISQQFLDWFVAEQLEEISKMSTILNIVKRAGDNILMAEQYIVDAMPEDPNAPA